MPRPKPSLDDRRRVSQACSSCKSSKIKCDGKSPCSTCLKKDIASACRVVGIDGRRRNGEQQKPVRRRSPANVAADVSASCDSGIAPSPISIVLDGEPLTGASTPVRPRARISSAIMHVPAASLSATQDDIVDSETASSSFLQYLRETLRTYVGSTSFTEAKNSELHLYDAIDAVAYAPDYDSTALLSAYHEAVRNSGVLWLVNIALTLNRRVACLTYSLLSNWNNLTDRPNTSEMIRLLQLRWHSQSVLSFTSLQMPKSCQRISSEKAAKQHSNRCSRNRACSWSGCSHYSPST
jgi:hypothetical protein